jgi:hypothetical protein
LSVRLHAGGLAGGRLLGQHTKINLGGYDLEGVEVTGCDLAFGTFPPTVYASMIETPLPIFPREHASSRLNS